MANENKFKNGSNTSDKGWTHGSVSANIIDETAWSTNSDGSTILRDVGSLLTTTDGAKTKEDTDPVKDAIKRTRRVIAAMIDFLIKSTTD